MLDTDWFNLCAHDTSSSLSFSGSTLKLSSHVQNLSQATIITLHVVKCLRLALIHFQRASASRFSFNAVDYLSTLTRHLQAHTRMHTHTLLLSLKQSHIDLSTGDVRHWYPCVGRSCCCHAELDYNAFFKKHHSTFTIKTLGTF